VTGQVLTRGKDWYTAKQIQRGPEVLRFVGNVLGGIFSAATLGLVLAALTLGGVFFMYSRDLPSHENLAQYTPATISRIYSGEGRIIDEFAQERRLFVASEDIPDLVKQAFISAEDKSFYSHNGYDPRAMVAAFVEAVASRGENVRGASTITQQVAKNSFCPRIGRRNARSRRSFSRPGWSRSCPRTRSLNST